MKRWSRNRSSASTEHRGFLFWIGFYISERVPELTSDKIIFKNSDFVAIDKGTNISIHNGEDTSEDDLIAIVQRFYGLKTIFPVHRLDKETTGVQIFAFNQDAARLVSAEFQNRSVKKNYHALVSGPVGAKSGGWNWSLTDKSEGRRSPAGASKDRVVCETRFERIDTSKYFSHLNLQLITGRTHQIRKHAALAGHAVVGDARYGDSRLNRRIVKIYSESRMFLHCHRIEIFGETIISPLPEVFSSVMMRSKMPTPIAGSNE